MDITALPFNALVGIQRAQENTGALLMLPADTKYTNHLGTVHAGALLSLAEATSGEYLLRHVDASAVVPVVRRMESKFKKPGNGAIYGKAHVPGEAIEQCTRDLQSKGRATIDVPVELASEDGTVVFTATVEWFVAMRK